MACISLMILSAQNRDRLKENQRIKIKAIELAFELQQSSENLTRMARNYVMTGDLEYKSKYQEILDIRNGLKARADGQMISFSKLLEQLNLTEEEKALLETSESNSNELAEIEIEAFQTIENLDDSENVSLDKAHAQQLMFGEIYYQSKVEIMAPVQRFNNLVRIRIEADIAYRNSLAFIYVTLFAIAFAGLLIVVVLFILSVRKKILRPLESGVKVVQRIEQGEKFVQWAADESNELGTLAESFNNMMGSINEGNEELRAAIDNAMMANAKLNSQNIALEQTAIVSVTDVKGKILSANKKFSEVSQYSMDEIVGQNHRIVNSGHHDKEVWADMYKHLANGKTWRKDIKNKAKDGSYYWVDSIMVPVYYDNDKPQEYLAVRFLITEKKEAEEKVLRLNAQLTSQNIALNESAIVAVTDLKGTITYANEMFSKISQFSPEEALGANHRIVNSGHHDVSFWKDMYATIGAGKMWRADVKNKAKDGTVYWVDSVIVPILGDNGKPKEYLAIRFLITDRKEAELQLKESEERFSSIVQNVPGIIFRCLIDEAWTMLFISEQVETISGYPAADFIDNKKRSYADMIVPEDLQKVQDAVAEKIKIKEQYAVEYRITRADGSERWVKSQGQAVFDENDEIKWLDGAIIDITDQKLAQAEIKRINMLSDNALELTKSGFWYYDLSDENHIVLSDKVIAMLGADVEKGNKYPMSSWNENMVKADAALAAQVDKEVGRALSGESDKYNIQYPIHRPKMNDIIWVHDVGHIQKDEHGNPVQIFGVLQNITVQKLAEQEIKQMSMLSDNALSLTKAGFWHIDYSNPDYYYGSEKAANIFGEANNDEYKYHLMDEWYARIAEADPKIAEQTGQNYQDAIDGKIERYDTIYPYKRPSDGEIVWIRAIGDIERDDEGNAKVMYGVAQDITDTILNEKALAEAKAEAEAATEAKSSFLANMSHEIRTPMNAIIGFSHLIQKTQLNEKQEDYIYKIESSSKSLLGIINDILDFSKIEAGKLTIENTDFDLENVFQDLANIITYKAHEKGLEIVFGIDSKVPTYLNGDPLRLGQILTNLSNNALKFTAKGEVVVTADLESDNEEYVVIRFSVKDSGIGIEKDKIPMLFESFTQADTSTSRKFGGTGLGLTISKNLAEMMDGKIWAESEYGAGSTFSFTAKLKKQKQASKELVPSTDLRGLKVLVVDDSQAARETLREALESFSFEVTTANSAKEGIDILKKSIETPYELVLMDWNMPNMDGLEASEIIINDNSIPNPPLIMMVTAYGKEDVIQRSEKLGLASLLIKPVRYSLLFDSIMNCFGKTSRRVSKKDLKLTEQSIELDMIRGAEILLAEDNLINQQVATELLQGAGFKVTIANNGLEVLDHLEQKKEYDIILMDLQMPEMGGYETASAIRLMDKFKDLPIVAMTADAMEGVKEKCFQIGMNGFITKPIDPAELFSTLLQWINHKKREVDMHEKEDLSAIIVPDIKGVNIEDGLARVGGNKKLFINLLRDFASNNKDILEEANEAANSGDNEKANRIVHTLKGTSGNLGMTALHEQVIQFEESIHKNGWDQSMQLQGSLNATLIELIECIVVALPLEQNTTSNAKDIKELLGKMEAMLNDDDPGAIDVLDELGAMDHPLFDKLKDEVNGYDFENGLKTLNEIKASY